MLSQDRQNIFQDPTNNLTLSMTPWISSLSKLPLFTPQCTGSANQMMICPLARP